MLEGLRLHSLLGSSKYQKGTADFWRRIEAAGHLPERSAESMKQFWKRYALKSIEDYLIECIHEKVDFCFSFKEIPSPDFEKRFREQYLKEFEMLEEERKYGYAHGDQDFLLQNFAANPYLGLGDKQIENDGKGKASAPVLHQKLDPNLTSPQTAVSENKSEHQPKLENLIAEPKAEEKRTVLKPVQKLKIQSYNVRFESGQKCLTQATRPQKTLEEMQEVCTKHRNQIYVPNDFDLPDYSTEVFAKQMEIERVTITLAGKTE